MEKLDNLVLVAFSEKIFTKKRIKLMLKELKIRNKKNKPANNDQLKSLKNELKEIDLKTERLLEAVESGYLPMDTKVRERAQRHKARREDILIQIAGLKREKEIPLSKITLKTIDEFCTALKRILKDKSSNFGKDYLRLLVDEIRIKGKEIRMKGRHVALAGALLQKKMGTLPKVPIFNPTWLPDSLTQAIKMTALEIMS